MTRRASSPSDTRHRRRSGWPLAAVLFGAACATTAVPPSVPPPAPAEIPALESRVALDSTDAAALVRLAAAYRAADRVAEADGALERAAALRTEDARSVLHLAVAYEDLGRIEAARAQYARVAVLDAPAVLRRAAQSRVRLLDRRILVEAVRGALAREGELAAAPAPRTVAVFPFLFAARDPQLEPLGRALAELLVTDLSQVERLTVLERARVQLLLDEMRLAEEGVVDPATAARSGRLLGAGRIVQGRIAGDSATLRLDAAVVGVGGEWDGRIEPVTAEDELRRLFDLEKELAFGIFASLGIELTAAERERIGRRPTQSLAALLEYGRGLEAADRGDFSGAADFFTRAAELDPGFDRAAGQAAAAAETAAAASVTTSQLAGLGGGVGGGGARGAGPLMGGDGVAPPPGLDGLDEIQLLVPRFGGRDPVAEILGQEGIGRRAVLVIILPRPAGTR